MGGAVDEDTEVKVGLEVEGEKFGLAESGALWALEGECSHVHQQGG